ncbi:MAG: 30S ribosomal protein S21 [Anaerolineales bacterium]|nr:30S ribosomal protein S21 [Anaerolineales bacterium]
MIDLTKVTIKHNESPEELLRRFRKKVMRSGRLAAARQKRWFVSKAEVRRIEKKKAIRRLRRRHRPRR